jgi:hypothetical protein
MRYPGGLTALLLLAGCNSKTEPSQAPPSSEAALSSSAVSPVPTVTVSDPDPTKAASLWLDRQTEPRQKGKYAPRDACRELPGARAFREKLAAAVEARDADAVAAMASPDIRLGFAGEDERRRFLAALKAPDRKAMNELAALLPLGCAGSDGGGLTIPWYFAQDYGDVDSYSAMLVMGADVPLHATADAGSAAKQQLSWDLVTLDKGWFPEKKFQQVTVVGSGGKGYVATDKLRSMLDYRLLANRNGDSWRITAFVAGD